MSIKTTRSGDKTLIRELRFSKNWRVKKFIKEFLEKNWKCLTLNNLLRKIDKTRYVQNCTPDKISTAEYIVLSQGNDDNCVRPREIEQTTGVSLCLTYSKKLN